jgi:kinesin family protein 22
MLLFILAQIQEQISKAVEIEVARRLKEAEEKRKKEQQTLSPERRDTPASSRRGAEQSSILSPLLKRHRDLNKELKARLSELEKKMCVIVQKRV